MRLLERQNDGRFYLTANLLDDDLPPYAILSHTWGQDSEEVTFEDMVEGSGRGKAGYDKIKFCGEQAAKDGLQYFWVDSCCIKKSSDAELSEAINSMFRWYSCAAKCYVYLSDVSTRKRKERDQTLQNTWEPAFRESKWYTRGWTLQELLAPASVEFFSEEHTRLGDKQSLEQQIHEITGIPISAIRGRALTEFTVDERMSWAAKRKTRREEDKFYSLLGIFGTHMPLIYGEGMNSAHRRLLKEIHEALNSKSLVYHQNVFNGIFLFNDTPSLLISRYYRRCGACLEVCEDWIEHFRRQPQPSSIYEERFA
jgi:hypothetical protein